MFANGLISNTFQDFSSRIFMFQKIDSLFFSLKAKLICQLLIPAVFLITKGDFRVFSFVGHCGCTQFNGHNLFYFQDRHIFIDIVASPEWQSEWLTRQMHPQYFIWYPKPSLQSSDLFALGIERVNNNPNPGQWAKGKVSCPRQ